MASACLLAAAATLLVTPVVGCGGGQESGNASAGTKADAPTEASSEYVTVLREFREAVAAEKAYDAYGFAEYMPATQRAAIDAFCFVADQVLKGPEVGSLEDPALVRRITRKAEADLKAERDIVAPGPAGRAIRKLRAVLELEAIDRDLAKSYVRACYHA